MWRTREETEREKVGCGGVKGRTGCLQPSRAFLVMTYRSSCKKALRTAVGSARLLAGAVPGGQTGHSEDARGEKALARPVPGAIASQSRPGKDGAPSSEPQRQHE